MWISFGPRFSIAPWLRNRFGFPELRFARVCSSFVYDARSLASWSWTFGFCFSRVDLFTWSRARDSKLSKLLRRSCLALLRFSSVEGVFLFRRVFRGVLTAMEDGKVTKVSSAVSDVVLGCVMPYIHDPKDRDAASLVCRRWYELDALTRKHVTIALCYTTSPDRLRRRFRHLESLKLKGKPRAAMFNLIPEDWGGYVTPWVTEIAESFNCLRSLHFRRMIVRDSDLELLARSRGRVLQALKLDKCSGFSTDGLLHIGRSCRYVSFICDNSSCILVDLYWILVLLEAIIWL